MAKVLFPRIVIMGRWFPHCVTSMFGCECPHAFRSQKPPQALAVYSPTATTATCNTVHFPVIPVKDAATTCYLHAITGPPWFRLNLQHLPALTSSRTAQTLKVWNDLQITISIIIRRWRPLCRGYWCPGVRFHLCMALLSWSTQDRAIKQRNSFNYTRRWTATANIV
jgi:hypothetical protein